MGFAHCISYSFFFFLVKLNNTSDSLRQHFQFERHSALKTSLSYQRVRTSSWPPCRSAAPTDDALRSSEDMYAQDSIDLLQKSGIQFPVHDDEGIEPFEFAELITTSGVVLMDDVKWISFHRLVCGHRK